MLECFLIESNSMAKSWPRRALFLPVFRSLVSLDHFSVFLFMKMYLHYFYILNSFISLELYCSLNGTFIVYICDDDKGCCVHAPTSE